MTLKVTVDEEDRVQKVEPVEETRRCRVCFETKPLIAGFYRKPGSTGGYDTACKVCHNRTNAVSKRARKAEARMNAVLVGSMVRVVDERTEKAPDAVPVAPGKSQEALAIEVLGLVVSELQPEGRRVLVRLLQALEEATWQAI